jgi:hypothetical protein
VHRIDSFDVDGVRECSDVIRTLGGGADAMEAAAARITQYLYDELGDGNGGRACALVRLYKTHPYGGLPAEVQAFAAEVLGEEPPDDVRCLTLLGTAGDRPEWNARRASRGHQAIPLPSEQFVVQLPMVHGLITQLGLEISTVVQPERTRSLELAQRTYDVFHVPNASGSRYLPAQDFVSEAAIASALGFGGMLYTGDFYAVVLFSKVPISTDAAQMLKILALATRVPLLANLRRVFSG